MAKFEAPIIKDGDFMTVRNFKEYEDLYGKRWWRARPCSPATLILHTNPLNFPKIQTVV